MLSVSTKEKLEKDVDFEFDCPECGAHIHGDASKCPSCGIEFVIEEVVEGECPHCGKIVSLEAEECSACGAVFKPIEETVTDAASPEPEPTMSPEEEEALKQEFAVLVAQVKPLMQLAQDNDIDSTECRRLIDKAVRAGKQRDLPMAVHCVKECHMQVVKGIEDRIDHDTHYLMKLIQVAKGMGTDPTDIVEALEAANKHRSQGDYEGALELAKEGRKISEKVTGKYLEAHELCDQLLALIQNSERFYVDTREPRRLLQEAQDASAQGDWSMMGILARKGREELLTTLPDVAKGELKKAKSHLLEMKAEGMDVSPLVKILKDAGVAIKTEKYDEALDLLVEYKSEMKLVD